MIKNSLKIAAGLALSATLFTACCDKTNCDKANESAATPKNTINYSANETTMQQVEKLELTQEWDKVFPKSEKVDHKKVTFVNNFGITLAADMYIPKDAKLAANGKFPAIAVSGPFGAIKELLVIKDANHTDLYDGGENKNFIPWDKLEKFYTENLK